jgi:nucleoside-diphosphate-sugar epimerase/membrane protease YdiL (CAAX protease family)
MRVLVAGGTGLLGRATVDALVIAGHDVVVVSRNAEAHVDVVRCDLGAGPPSADAVEHVDAIVNLVGIAVERGDNTFVRAHIDTVDHLVALARAIGVRRFVQVSVVHVPGAHGPYHETKLVAEERVRACDDLDLTLVRPGLVYGDGDDMMRNVVGFVRMAPIFPVPGGPPGPLQVVDVRDVAEAIVRTLARDVTIGRSYDIVGPERLSLRELVARVSDALGLPTITPAIPPALMHVGARVAMAVLPRPPVTTTQLGMLIAGLYGDPAPARIDLDLEPRPLTADRIRELAAAIPSPLPSLRLAPAHADLLARGREAWATPLRWFPFAAAVAFLGVTAAVPSTFGMPERFLGVLAVYIVLCGLALRSRALPWRELLRPSLGHIALGLLVAAVMLAGAVLVVSILTAIAPDFIAPAKEIYRWADDPSPISALVLVAIILGEDIAWRGVATLLFAGRLGPGLGVLAAGSLFAVAHVALGPPVLWLAALVAGTFWSALALRTRSLVPVIVSHVAWDVGMVLIRP